MAYKVIFMSDIDKIIKQIYKYCDSDSILVIDEQGQIRRIYCPFAVLCIVDVDVYKKGEYVIVRAVKIAKNLLLVYVIGQKNYYYYFFKIT